MTERTRTLAQAIMDARYATHYGTRNEAFWRRIDTVFNLVGAFGGSAAFASALGGNSHLSAAVGAVLALTGCAALALRPMDRVVEFRDMRRKFAQLDADGWGLTLAEFDQRLKSLQHEAHPGLRSLASTAWNDNMLANGYPDRVVKLSWLERVAKALA